jgi:hypothetical protein
MQKQAKNVFIIKSTLTTMLPLELAYRNPGTPAPTDVDNHLGFNKPTNSAVIANMRTLITQEQTLEDQVTLETTKPGVYRVTENIQ